MTHLSHVRTCLLILTALLLPAAAQACPVLTLSQAPKVITYDPFTNIPQSVSFKIAVDMKCAALTMGPEAPQGDRALVWFSDGLGSDGDGKIGGAAFDIQRSGTSFFTTSSGAHVPIHPDHLVLSNNQAVNAAPEFTYTLKVPANQVAQSATKSIWMKYSIPNASDPSQGYQSVEIPFALDVAQAFDLRLADGKTAGEIDFGTFSGAEETRALDLQVGATLPYKITMTSTQGQQLRRTSVCGVAATDSNDLAAESISYTAKLNGTPFNATTPFSSEEVSQSDPSQRKTIPLSITIPAFKPIERRAGHYCDVITLRIAPRD